MLRKISTVTFVLIGSALMALVVSIGEPDPDRERLSRGQALVASGRFLEGAEALAEVTGDPASSSLALEARLLRVRALTRGDRAEKAAEAARTVYEALPATHPGRGRARFLLSEAFEAMGKEDEAARLQGAEAAAVLGEGHLTRVAGYYLALAKDLEREQPSDDPLRPARAARPKEAADLYSKALSILTDGKVLASVTLPRCRNLVAAASQGGRRPGASLLRQAVSELGELLKQVDLGLEVTTEARYLRARAQAGSGLGPDALTELQRLLANPRVAETPWEPAALILQGEIFLADGAGEGLRLGLQSWKRFLERHPDHADAPAVRVRIADALEHHEELEEALEAFRLVADDGAAPKEQRARALFMIGSCQHRLAAYEKARTAFRRYLATYPDHDRVPEAQRLVPELLLEQAKDLQGQKDHAGAVNALQRYLEESPLSGKAGSVAVEVGLVLREGGKRADARAAYRSARDRYRTHDPEAAGRAGLQLGDLEEKEKNLEAAAAAYREVVEKFGKTKSAGQARVRLQAMEQVELSLATPRIYVPGDPVSVDLTVRNVPEASMRIYRLDARDYFERKGSLDGAAGIEVALVKSDRMVNVEVPRYQRYRRDEIPLAVELEKGEALPAGSYLVALEAKDRRAVVLVLVSDTRLVVKQSPFEVFCWATDARSGKPRRGVEILLRAKGVNEDLKTGVDGVARLALKKPVPEGVRVLGMNAESAAPGLSGAPPKRGREGLAPRVAFTLDRPVYRPGTPLSFRAVLRDVSEGSFATPARGTKVTARLRDPRGRVLGVLDLDSQAFGVVHGVFELSPDGAVGDHALEIDFAKNTFRETVVVRAYTKPEYRVRVSPKRRVVRPGEEVDIAVDVAYYFGGPVREGAFEWRTWRARYEVDRERYLSHAWYLRATRQQGQAEPGANYEFVASGAGSLDADGRGRFTFASRADPWTYRYLTQVRVRDTAGAWVTGSGSVFAGPADMFAVVLAGQQTYRAGDKATFRVVTADLGHRAKAAQGRLHAYLLVPGPDGDEALRLATGAEVDTGLDGEASIRLSLEKAGRYTVRFEGKDSHGAPVLAETSVEVSGERPDLAKEAVLRFEKNAYLGGEEARLHLSVPVTGRPALLTFEGEKVLEYRILVPKERHGVHGVVLGEDLAPNVMASIAIPVEDRLLSSQDRVVVLRYLDVKVEPERELAAPGEKIGLRVSTRDQLERPVRASVALRVVDGALSGLGGRDPTDPRFVFNRDRRPHLVVTTSSQGFRFQGLTKALDPDLVDLQAEKEIRARLAAVREFGESFDLEEPEEELEEMDELRQNKAIGLGGGAGGAFGGRRGGRRNLRAAGGGSPASPRPDAAARPAEGRRLQDRAYSRSHFKRGESLLKDRFKSAGLDLSNKVMLPMVEPSLREKFLDVAGWWPQVTTDASGSAVVELELPDNLTTWEILGSGTTEATSVGQGISGLLVTQDVLMRVDRPRFLTSRDEVVLPAVVHSNLKREIDVVQRLRATDPTVLEGMGMEETSFRLASRGVARRTFRFRARGAGAGLLEGSARSTVASDALKVGLPVIAFGEQWSWADRKELADRAAFRFDLDHEPVKGSGSYAVVVEAGMEADVLDGLRYLAGYPYGCLEQSLNRFLPAMILAGAYEGAGRPPLIDRGRLGAAVRQGLVMLRSFQRDDGTFGYWPGGKTDPWVTALCVETLARIREHGYPMPADLMEGARKGAEGLLSKSSGGRDARVALLLALHRIGSVHRGVLNSVFRERSSLSVQGVARLLLASDRARQPQMVQGLLEELRSRRREGVVPFPGHPALPWLRSGLEATSLALLAYETGGATAAEKEPLVKAVRAGIRSRSGGTKAVALGLEAIGAYVVGEGARRSAADVLVLFDGAEVARGRLGEGQPTLALEIPKALVAKGSHQIEVRKSGGTDASCRVVLRNTRGARSVVADGNVLSASRRIIPYRDPNQKKREYAPGFSVVRPERRPRPTPPPTLDQAVLGRKVTVELRVKAREDLEHVVLSDPQLGGLEVIETGVRGPHDRFERREAQLLFFFNRLKKGREVVVSYPCYAVYEGQFASLPARGEEMYAPERWGRTESGLLTVVGDPGLLARVAPPAPTPDELYARGVEAFDGGLHEQVVELLGDLPERWELRDEVHDDILMRLLVSRLRLERWSDAVKTREALRLRNPGKEQLANEDRERLGRAYLAVGDALSARSQFQRVLLSGFATETAVVDTYRALGQPGRAVDHLVETLLRYPLIGQVAGTHATLPGRYLEIKDADLDPKDASFLPPLKQMRWKDALWSGQSLMAWHQGTPQGEAAGYQHARLLGRLGLAKPLVTACRRYLSRHPDGHRSDAVTYQLARALFSLGRYEDAAKPAEDVWKKSWLLEAAPRARRSRSDHRWQAGYLLGRMAHVAGRYAEATTWYGRVREHVPDAQQSWLFFTARELAADRLLHVAPGSDVRVRYTAKNVEDLKVQVYPVDLAVLFAVQKSFDGLAGADLAGIRPARVVEARTGLEPHARGEGEVSLGTLDRGAALIVLRAGDLAATSLLLVTEARLTVQRGEGAVRVYLVDGKGKPVRAARIKCGVDGRIFHSGETDERGMLDVKDPGGRRITVVAETDTLVAVGIHP